MTRLDALRKIVTAPREVDQGRIGKRVIHEKADGREKLNFVFRVMRFTKRKVS